MTVRSIPAGLAPLLQMLELEQPRVLTAARLADFAHEAGIRTSADMVVRRLREHGWLLPLATRGVWEFAPADRAGPFGSGDPLIELRAVLARNPDAPYAAAGESAAYLLGHAGRRPQQECIGAPPGARLPKSLCASRVVHWAPASPYVIRDGLPTWSPATLIAFMASRPAAYHDWPNVGEWLRQAASAISPTDLVRELEGRSAGSWMRAAYLMDRGGQQTSAEELMRHAPPRSGPYYLGDRAAPGRYSRVYDVVDSTGMEFGR